MAEAKRFIFDYYSFNPFERRQRHERKKLNKDFYIKKLSQIFAYVWDHLTDNKEKIFETNVLIVS